jgi:5-methyltetrahydropteroyltriglutamate--homocysteine methyltransferase
MKRIYRADHVGSLLRPDTLRQARAAMGSSPDESKLSELEDKCILDAIAMQERVGLKAVTDGEFRRETWNEGFIKSVKGYGPEMIPGSFMFKLEDGTIREPRPTPAVSSKLERQEGIVTDQFKYLASHTKRVAKTTIPSTSQAFVSGGDRVLAKVKSIYPDLETYLEDVAAIYRQEIVELYELGCRYLQIDEVALALCCDPKNQEIIRLRGDDPNRVIDLCIRTLATVLSGRPADMTINMHLCRGNVGQGMAAGGYEPIAERLFNEVDVDGFLLEFDTERAGDFTPLRHVPSTKTVALGLVSTKKRELETSDDLHQKIDEASQHIDIKQLALCPQCGFGTTYNFQTMTVADEERKLARIVEVADNVWGNA